MIENTSGYSLSKLIACRNNDSFLYNEGESGYKDIQYVLGIEPDVKRLKMQASTFALNFRDHGAYNFPKLFGCRDYEVLPFLEELYIYSFMKSYYTILFPNVLDNGDMGGFVFKGHSQMFAITRRQTFSHLREGVAVHVSIDLGDYSDRKIKFALLSKHFSFLNKYNISQSTLGVSQFLIPEIEIRFSILLENYYSKRADGEPDTLSNKSDFSEGIFTKMVSTEMNQKGSINIVHLRNNESQYILEADKYPLTNTFYQDKSKTVCFMEVNGNYQLRYNVSFFFPVANFFTIKLAKSSSKLIDRYYKKIVITEKQNFMLNSEVYSITGIKGGFHPQFDRPDWTFDPFNGMSFDNLANKLRETPDSIGSLIDISRKIDEILKEFGIDIDVKIETENKGKSKGK